jgi:hypothetical protein
MVMRGTCSHPRCVAATGSKATVLAWAAMSISTDCRRRQKRAGWYARRIDDFPDQRELCRAAGKNRIAAAGADLHQRQVAEGVQDGDDTQSGQQEDQSVPQAQVVVHRAEQDHDQRRAVAQPASVGST